MVTQASQDPRPAPSAAVGAPVKVRRLEYCDDLLPLHEADPGRYPCLLESVSHGTPSARYDILFAATDERLILDRNGLGTAADGADTDFLACLDRWWRQHRRPPDASALPFTGGWFVFLAYELAAYLEPRLAGLPSPEDDLPIAMAIRCPAALIRDRAAGCTYLVEEAGQDALSARLLRDLAAGADRDTDAPAPAIEARLREDPSDRFLSGIERIRRYIVDGDVFQVNLSRAWTGSIDPAVSDADLYRRLRRNNPAPFSAVARIGDTAIVSSSPERLFSVRAGRIETRPIAGTHPRGADPDSDAALSRRLLGHPKERAEHIMLIDLERNDLGRVCRPGSVHVSELMTLESYAHVHHIVSNVVGRLDGDATPGDIIRAVFPGGTITGCPKIRCMEIIGELEQCARGAYTGSLGYLDGNGNMDFNILIRTLARRNDRIALRAGAGIVADSDPERELAETRAKARGLLRALNLEA
ncbi:MAG: aminodeoxychorismate synthase component I [Gammaproteobacteria bacterium]|nr:aminodeoxychorismate synthase component I [Gammaproteobacteria bacterium]